MSENQNEAKAYELRGLTADDLFPMFQIISKIGIKEFKTCFESADVQKAVSGMVSGEKGKEDLTAIGMTIAFDLAGVVVSNLPKCKDDIYLLLAQLSGMGVKGIAKLPMMTFVNMVMDVIRKDEFKDFFQAAARLFK